MSPDSKAAPTPRLGRYELLYTLGSGGMGSVWIARGVREPEKLFVVKTLLAEHADNPDFREMFFDEARIASAIDHVNVAHIFDLGDENGTPYLVMEVVDGESLLNVHRTLRKRELRIPLQISLRIVADVCAGLHAAHELRDLTGRLRDVVHRDVSPHNILVGMNGVTKVIDFGIAKARDRGAGTTTTGALKGKIRYMSPEQAAGRQIDRRSDVWATGIVLYLILTGNYAVDGPHDPAILGQLLFGGAHPPLPDSIPLSVRQVVDRALDRDLSRRYPTADKMRSDIEDALLTIGSPISTADVAAFMKEHFQESAEKRYAALREARASDVNIGDRISTTAIAGERTRFEMAQTVHTPMSTPSVPHDATLRLYDNRSGTSAATSPGSSSTKNPALAFTVAGAFAVLLIAAMIFPKWSSPKNAPTAATAIVPADSTTSNGNADAGDSSVTIPGTAATSTSKIGSPAHPAPGKSSNRISRPPPNSSQDPLERAMDSRH